MLNKKCFRIIIAVLLLVHTFSSAQKPQYTKEEWGRAYKAFAAFEAGEYFKAIDLFKNAYDLVQDKEKKSEILFKLGECCRIIGDNQKAEMWFKKAIEKNHMNPMVYLYYADALKANLKFKEASENYEKFKNLMPEDYRGANGIKACEEIPLWIQMGTGYEVINVKPLNTKSADFSPALASDDYSEIVFTSSRPGAIGTEKHGATGESFSDLYFAKMDRKGKWSEPVPLSEEINTEFEEGAPNFSNDYKTMYYTVCKKSKNKQFGCQIFSTNRTAESWGKGEAVEFLKDSIIVAHPAISSDGQYMYFVSDMDGTLGGKDIWMAPLEGSKMGTAENLGDQINTPGNELFPFVHSDGTLYFSSDGHPGMGGLDIFKAKKGPDGKWKVENMKFPINSNFDDFSITFEKELEKGYFSSGRNGKDDDIFAFVLPPLKYNITGLIKDEKTEAVLNDALVKAIGSDGSSMEFTTGKEGSFKFSLKPNTDYVFVVSRKGYLNGKERETTKGLDRSKDFKTSILLASISKPIELPNIFYDFGKADLRPESMVALDKLIETLNDNPNITIELMSHTDSRGKESDNTDLSQKRAQSVINYLIEKSIAADRLTAKGYGESSPKTVDNKMVENYPFLTDGAVLSEDYINKLGSTEQQETAHQINRRTEFRVIRTDYIPKK